MKQFPASTKVLTFSPTGTSKQIAYVIAEALAGPQVSLHDLTYLDAPVRSYEASDLVVIALPVYAGRIAPLARSRFAKLAGNGARAVLLAVYGNRDYEDALLEMDDLARECGFAPIAAAAFIGEHSFSSSATPIAPGRPDLDDYKSARDFAEKLLSSLPEAAASLQLPGTRPYKAGVNPIDYTPVLDSTLCSGCGRCVSICPAGVIEAGEREPIFHSGNCIRCCACIKGCATGALSFAQQGIKDLSQKLSSNCQLRREPEFFFAQ